MQVLDLKPVCPRCKGTKLYKIGTFTGNCLRCKDNKAATESKGFQSAADMNRNIKFDLGKEGVKWIAMVVVEDNEREFTQKMRFGPNTEVFKLEGEVTVPTTAGKLKPNDQVVIPSINDKLILATVKEVEELNLDVQVAY